MTNEPLELTASQKEELLNEVIRGLISSAVALNQVVKATIIDEPNVEKGVIPVASPKPRLRPIGTTGKCFDVHMAGFPEFDRIVEDLELPREESLDPPPAE